MRFSIARIFQTFFEQTVMFLTTFDTTPDPAGGVYTTNGRRVYTSVGDPVFIK